MGFHGCQLVGEPVQFGSYKGLGWEKHHLSLWVQALKTIMVPANPAREAYPRERGKEVGAS